MAAPADGHRDVARKISLADDEDDGLVLHATPAERLQMVWPMTRDCWTFVPNSDAQFKFQRHVERVERRGRDKDLLDAKILKKLIGE